MGFEPPEKSAPEAMALRLILAPFGEFAKMR